MAAISGSQRLKLGWVLIIMMLYGAAGHLRAQFYFGRNKIQYEPFQWQVLQTEHFQIYFYSAEKWLAGISARFAEEAFDGLEQKFNHTIDKPIPLFIYSNHIHFQQTNILPVHIPEGVGGFFEFIKQRVVIPFNGNLSDFRHVITHELVHVFMHHRIATLASDLGKWDTNVFPLWFTEGLAELWSTEWDSQGELIIRDAVLNDYLYPLDSYELLRTGFLLYKEGQAFLRYYEDTYGSDRIRLLLETTWRYPSFQEAIEAVTGKDLETLSTAWKLSLKQDFAEALAREQVLVPGQQQITGSGANISPVTYQDGTGKRHVVYLTNRFGYTDIHQQDPDQQAGHAIIRGERTADRESLHFLQTGLDVNMAGSLIYVSKSGPSDVLRCVDLKDGREWANLQVDRLVSIRSPRWSPDGSTAVFQAQDYSGQSDLYYWDIPDQRLIRLTNDHFVDRDPCFSPDGRMIVFSSDRSRPDFDGGLDLFILQIQDRTLLQLTADGAENTHPVWVDDEPAIYYLSDRQEVPNIWKVKLEAWSDPATDTLDHYPMTNFHTGLYDINPFSRDSLVASSFQEYGFQIRLLPVDKPVDQHPLRYRPRWNPGQADLPDIYFEGHRQSQPYKLKYSLDFAQTNVAYDPIFGFLGGAQLSISDLLGNRYYHFLLANTAETTSELLGRFNLAVTMVDLKQRSNRAVGFFRFANEYYNPYEGFYFETSLGLRAALNYPVDVFRRLEFSTSIWQSNRDYYFGDSRKSFLISNYFSLVHDNSLWNYLGPIDGWRLRLTAGPTFDFQRSTVHNYSGLLDFRYYYRIHRQVTLAQRTMLWFNDGIDIHRFYIGGSWGLRGYRINEVYGRKFVMLNQELRFPFAQSLMLRFRTFGFGLAPLRGAAFFDIGNAWDEEFPGFIGSFGAGLRGLFLGGLVLRLDIGKKTDFHSLSKGLFLQFFFGWDF